MDTIPADVSVDALLLANSAEAPNGLLYLLGGAWSRCWPTAPQAYPYERRIPTVAVFRVPWGSTNIQHNFRILYQDADGSLLNEPIAGSFQSGRQPDLTVGASQVVVVTVAPVVSLAKPGLYYVAVEVNDRELKRLEFEALAQAPQAAFRR